MKTDIPGWLIVDPQTGERCMWFATRDEARESGVAAGQLG